MDNRDMSNPNNKIFITAPHASRDVKIPYLNSKDRVAVNSQIGYDIGSFEVATELAEKLKCIVLASNWSKLMIDYNKSFISRHLVPSIILHNFIFDEKEKDEIKLEMNRRPPVYERHKRFHL